ncbi:hypothetical protein [Pedobacter cryophilus]|uniref:Uncharacterized protein n=1 Tax=Pedobacter cryophilus TaxID=2571271 RepID=A0A4U1BVM2_9SPHI|nr:hypothetical protein [Pedobacter cryophilus]TKB96869.1 hypothetical protein FA046_12385 [Pedobacter cryophilus]
MSNKKIKFCHNWNLKLICKNWSTIRLKDEVKFQLNHAYDIEINDEIFGECVCVYIKHFKFSDISEPLFRLDMGLNQTDGRKMLKHLYADKNIDIENSIFSYMLFEWRPQYLDIKQINIEPGIQQILKAS